MVWRPQSLTAAYLRKHCVAIAIRMQDADPHMRWNSGDFFPLRCKLIFTSSDDRLDTSRVPEEMRPCEAGGDDTEEESEDDDMAGEDAGDGIDYLPDEDILFSDMFADAVCPGNIDDLPDEDDPDQGGNTRGPGTALTDAEWLELLDTFNKKLASSTDEWSGTHLRVVAGGRVTGGRKAGDKWTKLNTTDPRVKNLLPLRAGCMLEQFHVKDGSDRWQCWYPPLESAKTIAEQRQSISRAGAGALRKVLDWAEL